jgi:hypothetical protein
MSMTSAKYFSADVPQAKASLVAISQLEFDILLPGHGAPVMDKAFIKVKSMVTQLRDRKSVV